MNAIKGYDSGNFKIFNGKAAIDKAISTLLGIVDGITIDNKVNDDEKMELSNWIIVNESLGEITPFNEIIPIIKVALSDGIIDEEEIKDIIWLCKNFSQDGIYYDMVTLAIQHFHGVLHGILADNKLSDEEVICLNDWINGHSFLSGTYPYDDINKLLKEILKDGQITSDEKQKLKALIGEFIDCSTSYNISKLELSKLSEYYDVHGICAKGHNITIPEHTFCFTGKSAHAPRKEIEKIIIDHNGVFKNNVTKATNYLVIGVDGNPCWAFSSYGRKIEKAIELHREEGLDILLVHEDDFWSVI